MKKSKILSFVGLAMFLACLGMGNNLTVSAEPPKECIDFSSPVSDSAVLTAFNLFSNMISIAKDVYDAEDAETRFERVKARNKATIEFEKHFDKMEENSKKYLESLMLVNILRENHIPECSDARLMMQIYKNVKDVKIYINERTGIVEVVFILESIPQGVITMISGCARIETFGEFISCCF